MQRSIGVAGLIALAACVGVSREISVTDAGTGLSLAPRPPDCRLEFYRTKPPERAYDEIATVHAHGPSATDAQDAVRAKACELGADAVIVTRDLVTGDLVPVGTGVVNRTVAYLTGTAVSYPELRDVHRAEHALLQKNKRDEFENALSAVTRPPNLPPGFVAARARVAAALRLTPRGIETSQVGAGQFIWVEPEARGWRRAVASDGSTGYVDEDALELVPEVPAAPASSPGDPSARQRTNI
jgi:hypothetical protein